MKKFAQLISIIFSCALLLMVPLASHAHKNHPHPHPDQKSSVSENSDREMKSRIASINELYKKEIKPIFRRSCFDCHSQTPNLPWYHSVPIIRGYIDDDMKEAKEHLDFTNDFPFQGHGSPKEDLEAIADSMRDESMPPFRYRIMHWKTQLTDQEREMILKWAQNGNKILSIESHDTK